MRLLGILLAVAAIGGLGWLTFREGGWLNQVTEDRIETALVANGVPVKMAQCMAGRLTDQLSINQLRKLERLRPEEGESPIPLSTADALARLERVDDPEAVRALAITGTRCGIGNLLERLR
ncbi:MAG: hypothetical protein SXU28_13685 [Pseudomonadota bacterium]|nr:hypothetical protein [Pseudomonadota bacterium]